MRLGRARRRSLSCLVLAIGLAAPWAARGQIKDVNCNGVGQKLEGQCVDYYANGGTCKPPTEFPILRPCDHYVAAGPGMNAVCSSRLAPDLDGDGLGDSCDNCPDITNLEQDDADKDKIGDACDNCPDTANPDQKNQDGDRFGDACDLCPARANSNQARVDTDGDGIYDGCDVCPQISDPAQRDQDGDGFGDACDLCPTRVNPNQLKVDTDGDGVYDGCDVCPQVPDPGQADRDGDGIGDVCDNCPDLANADQVDADGDRQGDACEAVARGGCRPASLLGRQVPAPTHAGVVAAALFFVVALGRRRWSRN